MISLWSSTGVITNRPKKGGRHPKNLVHPGALFSGHFKGCEQPRLPGFRPIAIGFAMFRWDCLSKSRHVKSLWFLWGARLMVLNMSQSHELQCFIGLSLDYPENFIAMSLWKWRWKIPAGDCPYGQIGQCYQPSWALIQSKIYSSLIYLLPITQVNRLRSLQNLGL